MDMRMPPLKIQILLEPNPPKSIILVQYRDWPYGDARGCTGQTRLQHSVVDYVGVLGRLPRGAYGVVVAG